MSEDFKKVLCVGTRKTYGGRGYKVFVSVEYKDGRLSLHGVEGPLTSGNALGSCGQIQDYLMEVTPGPGWSRGMIKCLVDMWNRWHLNDMNAGCVHQRAAGWDSALLDDSKGGTHDNLAMWTYPRTLKNSICNILPLPLVKHLPKTARRVVYSERLHKTHPRGLLCKPCPVCGYKYGTSWLREEVPTQVLEWLRNLPESTITPAWL